MNIALGSDHRGAKFARLLTYNVLLPNHYAAQSEFFDPDAEAPSGSYIIENAVPGTQSGENAPKESRIYPIEYSLAPKELERKTPFGGATCVDYPDVAAAVAEAVADGRAERGVLICGTGVGMCITANKFKGIRAACCYNEVGAELSRRHNDANVLCLAGDFLSEATVEAMLRIWLAAPFDGGRHRRRLDLIDAIERKTGL